MRVVRTTKKDIREWIKEAKVLKAKYMIVMCDTFDYDDYSTLCFTAENCKWRIKHPGEMQRVIEVYDLAMDTEIQIDELRAYHPPE